MKTPLVLLGIAIVVGIVALLVFRGFDRSGDVPHTDGPVVVAPDSVMQKDRPTTKRTIAKRITTKRVKPQVAVSATPVDSSLARKYAELAIEAAKLRHERDSLKRAREQGDTSAHPDRVPTPKSILPPAQGRYDGRRFTLWAVRSDGYDARAAVKLGLFRPHIEFTMGMDPASDSIPVIDVDRWYTALARQSVRCLPKSLVVGGGVGALSEGLGAPGEDYLRSALVGGGLVLLGCIIG